MADIHDRSLKFYVDRINNNKPFNFLRYGDGEFLNIIKPELKSINAEMDYFPEAGIELKKTLDKSKESYNTFYGLQSLANRTMSEHIPDNFDWHNADVFHYASRDGKLFPLIEALKIRPVVFVGPKYLRKISDVIPYTYFIEIPDRNCYLKKEEIKKKILQIYKDYKMYDHVFPLVFSFSCSIAAEIIIYDLISKMKAAFLIDFGSLWDPFVGHKCRSYHSKVNTVVNIYDNGISKNACMMGAYDLKWLNNTAAKMNNVLEIGSYEGRSSYALLTGCSGTVYCVDYFEGSDFKKDWIYKASYDKDIYKTFLENVGHFSNLKTLKMRSMEAVKQFADKSLDMVFIDGEHRYDYVVEDIKAWLPKTKKIICGHDYKYDPVKKAVHDCLGVPKTTVENIWYVTL